MKINVFLPCKKNSKRIKNKNKRKFANINFGLVKIKLSQLLKSKLIDNIYLSTRNLEKTNVTTSANLNTYQILNAGNILMSESSLKEIEKTYKSK